MLPWNFAEGMSDAVINLVHLTIDVIGQFEVLIQYKYGKNMIYLKARPEALNVDPGHTALIIVDMQNAFVKPGGFWDQLGFDIAEATAVVETINGLATACRDAGVKVVYLQNTYNSNLSDTGSPASPHYHKAPSLRLIRQRPDLAARPTVEGTWDWQIVDELTPKAGDLVVQKRRYNGFTGTILELCLRGWEVRWLLFCGIATNVCVESTARDAYFKDFWPILIEDGLNHAGPDFNRKATLYNFEHFFGSVVNSENLLEALYNN